jgi:putative dimethyl sulfoxide reductase chaperone
MTIPQPDPGQAGAREDLCRFLSACYYEPDPVFAEERLFDSMVAAATRLDPELAASASRLREAFAAHDLETLLVDYARLFLGPPQALARPYASSWMSGDKAVMQESTLRVVDLYRQAGFDLDESFHEVPDHVAAELEFLYLLTFRENRATDAHGRGTVARLRSRFLDEHLARWTGSFTAAMAAAAETDFYGALAAMTDRFVALEAERSAAPA